MSNVRVRIHFTKKDDLRWISHRDLARVWERLLRRAGLRLAFSQGFHPKPKISFPSALALGIVALEEIVEMELIDLIDLASARTQIIQQMPSGMELLDMRQLPSGTSKAQIIAASYQVQLDSDAAQTARTHWVGLLERGKVTVDRDGKSMEAAFSDARFQIQFDGDLLLFKLPSTAQGSLRPSEVLAALGIAHVLPDGAVLTRTRVHLAHDGSESSNGEHPAAIAATS